MSHSYTTRSVTRSYKQLISLMSEFNSIVSTTRAYNRMDDEVVIQLIHSTMKCPDMMCKKPNVRQSMSTFIYTFSPGSSNQKLLAAVEMYDMFLEGIAQRPDYKV